MLAGVLLGVVNAVVRPIAVILTLPFTVLTIGLFLLVVNAAMLGLVALAAAGLSHRGFWAAFLAALIVSLTGWIGSLLIGSQREGRVLLAARPEPRASSAPSRAGARTCEPTDVPVRYNSARQRHHQQEAEPAAELELRRQREQLVAARSAR